MVWIACVKNVRILNNKYMKWFYSEMGSRDKKTGKLKYYKVSVEDWKIVGCTCEAREFRKYTPCKHMVSINKKLGHSL